MEEEQRFWRVYKSEWVVTYTSDAEGEDGERECEQKFVEVYEGRVRSDDSRTVPWSLSHPEWWPWLLELRLPTMKGEYSSRPLALEYARKIDGEVVLEGSRADKRILGYGKLMLRREHVDSPELDAEGASRGASGQAG
jgi:hypothetical protein